MENPLIQFAMKLQTLMYVILINFIICPASLVLFWLDFFLLNNNIQLAGW